MGDFEILILQLAVLLMSIVIHEVSHGIVALWQGDPVSINVHRNRALRGGGQ